MRWEPDRDDEEIDLVDPDASPPGAPTTAARRRPDGVVPWLGLAAALVVGGVLSTPTPIPRPVADAAEPPGPAAQVIWEATDLAGVTSLAWDEGTVVLWRAGWADIDETQVSQLVRTLDAVEADRTWDCGPAPGAAAWTQCTTDDDEGVRYVTIDPLVDLVEPASPADAEP